MLQSHISSLYILHIRHLQLSNVQICQTLFFLWILRNIQTHITGIHIYHMWITVTHRLYLSHMVCFWRKNIYCFAIIFANHFNVNLLLLWNVVPATTNKLFAYRTKLPSCHIEVAYPNFIWKTGCYSTYWRCPISILQINLVISSIESFQEFDEVPFSYVRLERTYFSLLDKRICVRTEYFRPTLNCCYCNPTNYLYYGLLG